MKLFEKIFGTYSDKEIKKIVKLTDAVEALSDYYSQMSDDELKGVTPQLKQRLSNGETLDDILPDAFAAVREAAQRTLGKRPFRVQIMGGILLHQGRIAEMKTGEGKTLVATLPAYLNALTEKGVHIVTVNDYLARCGAEEMGRVFAFLGLTTGLVVHGQDPNEKREAYKADITYGTNNEFGFDYLRDNMAVQLESTFQRGHNFAIVDEVDSVLIDEARTPLIISGQGEKSTDLYDRANTLACRMRKIVIKELDSKEVHDDADGDYIVDEKARSVTLTASGIKKAEEFFGIENLSDPENATIAHHVNQAIRAHGIMHNEVDYIVKEGKVVIVDAFTGRLMPGRRYNEGLHQAIEAKEHVNVERENTTLATITFQNYFRLYDKLSGMTGTALTEEDEFREIYNLDVVVVPTNKPMIRVDHNDMVYKTREAKLRAIINKIKECHDKGQPILVGTVSIDKSEEISKRLNALRIPHKVLNAKHHEKEAEIVAQAGKLGSVTISTNMAGRGTDIMLGGNPEFLAKAELRSKHGFDDEMIANAVSFAHTDDSEILKNRELFYELKRKYSDMIRPEADKVCELGGLFILGTERHESRRIDNQLRGRSGRQGDPGESCFYISFEDDLMRLFGGDRMTAMVDRLGIDEDMTIDATILSNSIESAQKRREDMNFQQRKRTLEYDDVMNRHRQIIYKQRRDVLEGADITPKIIKMIEDTVTEAVMGATQSSNREEWNISVLRDTLGTLLFGQNEAELAKTATPSELSDAILNKALKIHADKEVILGSPALAKELEKMCLLQNVDIKWIEHLELMDDLKGGIMLNAYASRNPLNEYRIAGADIFDSMIADIRAGTVRDVLSYFPVPKREIKIVRKQVAQPLIEGFEGGKPKPVRKSAAEKVGRNDPCPCGSGKKYKQCCGAGK